MFLIAPLDANTLAKISNGICDNLVTSIIRAWNFDKPVIVCPAMNTAMWNNPFTESHLNTLRNLLGIHVIDPQEKALMCGDIGMGAMADVQAVATYLASFL